MPNKIESKSVSMLFPFFSRIISFPHMGRRGQKYTGSLRCEKISKRCGQGTRAPAGGNGEKVRRAMPY